MHLKNIYKKVTRRVVNINNRGFAITSFLYSILIVFLIFFSLLLVNIINSKLTIDKLKNNANNMVADSFDENIMYAELIVEEKETAIAINSEIDLLEGVYLKKYDDKIINTQITYTSTLDTTKPGTYKINYIATFKGKTYTAKKTVIVLEYEIPEEPFEFSYSDDGEQTLIIEVPGYYKLETWGAQGGSANSYIGGYGGYSVGTVYLESGTELFINVGSQGESDCVTKDCEGGYNGGGNGGLESDDNYNYQSGGGGATHIATTSGLLSSLENKKEDILIVAGGGAGAFYHTFGSEYSIDGDSAGGYIGNGGTQCSKGYAAGSGGTQSFGGIAGNKGLEGSFGKGGNGISGADGGASGGGGGFYGGGAAGHSSPGGGSGYIGNKLLTDKYMYCYNCKESNGNSTKTISTTNVSETAQSDYAKINDGYARITFVSLTMKEEEITAGEYVNYDFIGKEEIFEVPKTGYYKIQTWGASGGNGMLNSVTVTNKGLGAYSEGIVLMEAGEKLYITVGGEGASATNGQYGGIGGYNGGGAGGTDSNYGSSEANEPGGGGGGATDVRYGGLNLTDRIIVAAGGAGGSCRGTAGYAGGLIGGYGSNSSGVSTATLPGSQISGNVFGIGGNGISATGGSGGGGAGYYGGMSGQADSTSGSGGSSFISGYLGSVAVTSSTDTTPKTGCTDGTTDIACSYHYSGKVFEDAVMITGNDSMPTIDETSTMIGNDGDGFAKITYLGDILKINVLTQESFASTDVTINVIASSELSNENKYQYYISTSNTELVGGIWKEYTFGEKFTVNGTNGRYYLWIYPISDIKGNITDNQIDVNTPYLKKELIIIGSQEYAYKKEAEILTVPTSGYYKLEAWGAQGGSYSSSVTGGKGAYTSGKIHLEKDEIIYVTVGGKGSGTTGGYNGGGSGGSSSGGKGGGGATDIRYFGDLEITDSDLLYNSTLGLNSRIMVAAGGGGADSYFSTGSRGGYAGGLTGGGGGYAACGTETITKSTGGKQTSGGKFNSNGTDLFGIGGSYSSNYGGGGGSGYYGGGAGAVNDCVVGSGAGGSSFISGYTGSVAITSSTDRTPKTGCTDGTTDIACSYHYSGKIFTETVMKAGNQSMPTQDGTSTMTGNSGDGFARITYVGEALEINVETKENFVSTDITIDIFSSSELSTENKYQYYISTSNTELVGGSWKEYTLGESFNVSMTGGSYYLWIYPISNVGGKIADNNTDINTPYVKKEFNVLNTKEYAYSGNYEEFVAPKNGNYIIELWGASGGASSSYTPGKGAYVSGTIYLTKDEKLYLYIGEKGSASAKSSNLTNGGYNGGGGAYYLGGTGGGATDIRYFGDTEISDSDLAWNSTLGLNSRIMVAAGGGGAGVSASTLTGGSGGALVGIDGGDKSSSELRGGHGGTQIAGGTLGASTTATPGTTGSFGKGGNGGQYNSNGSGAGGSGYYGGAGGNGYSGGGGGGSSFISGYTGSVAITSSTDRNPKSGCTDGTTDINCSYHYSGKIFTETVMKAGNQSMPTQDGTSTMTGNSGNGYAKITYIGSE